MKKQITKKKWYQDNQVIAVMALVTALMYVVGIIFERTGLGKISISVVQLNPTEGFIIIPLTLFGIKGGTLVALAYLILMAVTGVGFATPPTGIGFIAMLIALFGYIGFYILGSRITRPFKFKEPLRGWINLIIATLGVTMIMILLNIIFISPSFALGKFAFLPELMDTYNMSFWDVVKYVSIPPLGIIHGNLLKYTCASILAGSILSNKNIWKFKIRKQKK